eukprot:15453484-Alexandrium_andersonii.AAC.1
MASPRGVPDCGTVTSWCRTSGSETPPGVNCFACFQVGPSTVQAQCRYFTDDEEVTPHGEYTQE